MVRNAGEPPFMSRGKKNGSGVAYMLGDSLWRHLGSGGI